MLSPTWPTSHPSPLMFLFNTPLPLVASSLIHSPNFFHSFLGTREKEDGRVVRSTGSCVIDLGWGDPWEAKKGPGEPQLGREPPVQAGCSRQLPQVEDGALQGEGAGRWLLSPQLSHPAWQDQGRGPVMTS